MSTPQRITCPHCQGSIKAPPLAPGSICNCPKCGKGFPLPGGTPATGQAPSTTNAPVAKPQVAVPSLQPVRTTAGPKPPPPAPIRPSSPTLSPTANTATQPAHRQEPPPPKPALPPPKVVEIPVVCNVCGTRMYAKESQIGETLRCPDCYTDVAVKAPKVAPPPPKKKTLDEMEEFQLSDPGERPTYKPMVETRGEYSELQLLDTKAPPRKEQVAPGSAAPPSGLPDTVDPMWNESHLPAAIAAPIAATVAATTLAPAPSAMPQQNDDLDDQEVVLSAPVERIETKTEIKVPNIPPPPKEERKEPTWNDDEWGFISDARATGAWKKSPFYVGILGMLTDPQLLYRLAAYSAGLACVLTLAGYVVIFGSSGDGRQIYGLFCIIIFGVIASLWSLFFSPCLLAIATDTANGEDRVQSWPDWSITEWLFDALYIPLAATIAIVPGFVLASILLAGGGPPWLAPFPPLASLLAIFPIVISSMLMESSLIAPISGNVIRTLRTHGDGWVVLYGISAFLFLFLGVGVALVEVGIKMEGPGLLTLCGLAAILFVLVMMVYFRLVGRLMWYTQNLRKKVESP